MSTDYSGCEQWELDELVHGAKSGEASAINNAGREAQIAYLNGPDTSPERLALIERYYDDQMADMDFENSEYFIKKGLRSEAEGMTDAQLREALGDGT